MSRRPTDVASKERNEYIPAFISKKPFYVDDESSANDYLEHQRLQKSKTEQKWYDRGKRVGPAATKYRKGACENCGSMSHKVKECLSRPRKLGAKWTGKDIQPDEEIQKVDLDWDAKRDRWNGYDASEYRNVVEEYEELEALKRQAKERAERKELQAGDEEEEGHDGVDGAEEAKYAEESDMGRQQSTATRNLRLREDTAKYLLNLDLDSAKYDPKTRRMVDMGAQSDLAAALVAEENFIRASGDAAEFERAQRYAWESQERGDKDRQHLQANPTSGEYFRKKEKEQAEEKRKTQRQALLERYGGEKHLQPAPLRDAAVIENERFVEYDETGAIKGEPKKVAKSKYAEDILINNHTSVWGSWWSNFLWGYACCHSTVKNSYCTGEEGKTAFEEAQNMLLNDMKIAGQEEEEGGEKESAKEQSQLAKKRDKSAPDKNLGKRTLKEMQQGVTEEELEAYKKSRSAAADPMAAFLGKDELVR
ncbi:mRNA splicing protein [Blastomyces dermatitidis]|uniref:Pre-mRNA-splicing factor SLU7 n=3 Tax=Blastomyces TaxID=229219 RepID=A0A179UUT2_BLAGS|nr:pre-mRNA-splicing factor slu7 [Blastomyces gilchristii SLH14081]XP_045277514.1 pre-mRNA-splicing factor slu7 [Blastomyces dermatitidis ER-3]EGE78801.1 pre-mRNA-splicing factor slu7 [Blastomyces dermatitidis ATCC 18188]EQL36508.1 pre-mRNA-splicing factor slu7 [Blastomyces dermatitidis ATCC 26199]EEQ90861.1 pre-mRNA-splicing factor slu7 [Blastomyces dermatitidis ER-3]OAT10847.1 pre-mRNA-splicing factor slu7 [Blastomyces gilchristii SLH14081]